MIGPAARDAHEIGVDDRLALRVERARRLVQDQHRRIDDRARGDGQALPLAARQVGRALPPGGVVAARHALDEFFRPRQLRGPHDLVERGSRPRDADVLAHRAAEKEVLLRHHADAAPQMVQLDLAQVHAVDLDDALVAGVEPLQQPGDRRLARSAAPHDRRRSCRRGSRSSPRRAPGARRGRSGTSPSENEMSPRIGSRRPSAGAVLLRRRVHHRGDFAHRAAHLLPAPASSSPAARAAAPCAPPAWRRP